MKISGEISGAGFFCAKSPNVAQKITSLSYMGLVAVGALCFALVFEPQLSRADDPQFPPVDTAAPGPATPAVSTGDAFKPGDIAATSLAGTKLAVEGLPPGVDPKSKTFLDPNGTVLRIFSVPKLEGSAAGRTVNPTVVFEAKAQELGHVFGLAFDNLPANGSATPGLFAAATSAFGLQLVGPDGGSGLKRLNNGASSAAFMAGQFGSLPKAGPGTIYKIERSSGNVRVFANVETDGVGNSGPGLGGLAFDAASRTLYASDLETGIVHAFSSEGTDIAQFDHGTTARPQVKKSSVSDDGRRADIKGPFFDVSKPTTWGFTQKERRIDALAVHDGRLFYSVAEGPEVWSVGLDAGGKFASDPRLETKVSAEQPYPVTGIVFDQTGRMIVTQRGALENPTDYSRFTAQGPAQTLRYSLENPDDPDRPNRWKSDPQEYAVGNAEGFRSSSGGLALQYAYKTDGSIDVGTCGGTIIVSGDTLGAGSKGFGLQLGGIDLVRPANAPPVESTIINLDPRQDDPATRGHAGGIAVLQDCGSDGGNFPPVAGGGDAGGMPPVAGGDTAGGGGDAFPPVDTQEGGDGTTTDDGTGGGGTTSGALTMTKVPESVTCSENQSCSYTISIINNSDQSVPGPVVISDVLSIGGAPFQKAKLGATPADWTCVGSAAPGIQCTHPGAVEPNVPLNLTLDFTPEPGSLAGATELKNCVSFPDAAAPQGNGAQQLLPPPPPPTETNNGGLKVEMNPTTASCSPAAGNCEFAIKITNTTAQPITAPLKIFDTLAVGTQSQAKNTATIMQLPPGLQCKPEGREFNCSQENLTLAPNGSVSMKVAFSVDTTEGGEANFVQSKAAVTFGPLTGEATAAVAFEDNAKIPEPGADGQQAQGAGVAAPACASIPVAPSGPVVVNKKGPAKCPLKGPCAFTIDVTNSSNTPLQGPIEIEDTVDVPNATIAGAVAAPFSCDPGGSPFKCRFNGTLQPKETKTLSLTLNIDAPAGTKSLKNCAVPTQPQGAVPQQGQDQKQLAPGKKSELLPTRSNPILHFASFRPQSLLPSERVLHLAGGAGGNIGGVGPNNCLKWGMDRDGFNVTQSNGPQVGFGNLKVGPDGKTTGEASFIADDGPVTGTVEGTIVGSHVDLVVTWNRGVKKGHYVGDISPTGEFSGTNTASNGVRASFRTNRIWFQCAVDQFCQNYANEAVAAATEFGSLHCGAVGPGRFSTNPDEHIKFCMAQSKGGDSPIVSEAEARKTQLDSCREFDARCTKAGVAIATKNDEMKALNCKDAIPSLQPDKAKAACKASAIKFTPEALVEAMQQKLDACKVAKLNGDGGPGPGGPADPGNAQQPPANQCVTVELEDKIAPDQKPPAGLAISKNPASGKCSATGGGCDFVVTVFNPDPAVDFVGPVNFTDHISAPDGSAFPNITVQTPINPQADPGISGGNLGCKKDGNDVNCNTNGASLTIPPGKKIVIPMSFTPGGDSVAKAVKNCAFLPGGEQQCVTIPFAENGPLLRAKKFAVGKPETCVPNCEFVIQLSNVGNADAEGPFVLKDVFKAANGMDSFKMIGDSKFACSTTNGTIGCISTNGDTNKLAPGETISGFIVFNVNTVSPEYTNCLEYDPAAQRKPSPFDAEAGPLCATIKDAVHDRANILIRVTPPNAGPDGVGKCEINSPCRFMVRIDSNGVKPYLSNPGFNATLSPNRATEFDADATASKNWNCGKSDPGRVLTCMNDAVPSLTTPQFVTQEVTVVAGPSWTKNSTMTLCATLTGKVNTFDNFHGDNQDCKSVILDPFNVKVSKTGDQSCSPGGDCHFTINLFNPGPIDHNAPVTITDNLKGLSSAQILSIKPPLPCASQPTQIPFSCTSPGAVCLNLDGKAGEKCGPQTFDMVVRLPNNASATQFANCASVTAGEKSRSDEEACHTVSLKPASPEPASNPVTTPPPRQCFAGMILIGELCQCPPGTHFNGQRCTPDNGDGVAYPALPITVPPPRLECPASRPIGVYPNCCPVLTEYRSGACRPIGTVGPGTGGADGKIPSRDRPPSTVCPSNRPVGDYPNCCPVGTEYRSGACQSVREAHTPKPVCPRSRPVGDYPNCCPEGTQFRFGTCRSPRGSGGSNGTEPGREKLVCPRSRPIGNYPNCCPTGTEFRNGMCRGGSGGTNGTSPSRDQSQPQNVCPRSRPIGVYPNCCPTGSEFHNGMCRSGSGGTNGSAPGNAEKCPAGYHRLRRPNKYGAFCEPDQQQGPAQCPAARPIGTPPNCCPIGTRFRMGQCYPEKCSPGWIGVPPRCRPPKQSPAPIPQPQQTGPTPQKTCPAGQIGTPPNCHCPSGTTGPGCQNVIVR